MRDTPTWNGTKTPVSDVERQHHMRCESRAVAPARGSMTVHASVFSLAMVRTPVPNGEPSGLSR